MALLSGGPAGDLRLVDDHCHGVVPEVADPAAFEMFVSESFDPAPPGTSHLDSPVGLAIGRLCGPVLDVPADAPAGTYVERRLELGGAEANRRLLAAAGLGTLLVDTGYRGEELLGPDDLGRAAGAGAWEVTRLEAIAEAVAAAGPSAAGYTDAFREALWRAAAGGPGPPAAGLKSVVAYRTGFDIDWSRPTDGDIARAAGQWLAAAGGAGEVPRLSDPVLLRFGIWAGADLAAERGLPLQLHSGFGDPDLTLHLANPSLATPLVRELKPLGVNVVFLHCYPYHREAAYLAKVFPHVHFDLGAAIGHTGPSARTLIAESLELAPFSKQLFSTDAFGLAELYLIGAALWREGIASVLNSWVGDGRCTAAGAEAIVRSIGRENARRIYPIG